jgi:hypothetical protein
MGGSSGVAKLQKKAPNALISRNAELKSAPGFRPMAHTSGSPLPGVWIVTSRNASSGRTRSRRLPANSAPKKQSGNFAVHNALKNHKTRKKSRSGID